MNENQKKLFDLSVASMDGELDKVRELLISGADPSLEDVYNTALIDAIIIGRADIVEVLLEAGANPNCSEMVVVSNPIQTALERQDEQMLDLLKKYGGRIDNLLFMDLLPRSDNPDLVEFAMKNGFDPGFVGNKYLRTPLHITSMYGYLGMVKALVELGANISVTDKNGKTPSDLAAVNGNFEVVEYLEVVKNA